MSFWSFAKKEEKNSLLIDIGSGTVSVAIVSFQSSAPHFISYLKGSFPINENLESDQLLRSLGKILEQLISKTLSLNQVEIKSVGVSFSSPWYTFKSKKIHISEDREFIITKSFLKSITEKQEAVYQKELIEESGESNEEFSVIEKYIVHAKINGYVPKNIFGKKAKIFDAFLYISAVPKKIEERVVNIISKYTHINRKAIMLQTFPMVSFSVVRDLFATDSSFLLMDISGELTDISLVNFDVIVKNVSFPLGRNYIIKKLSKISNTSSEIALSMLHMYLAQKSDAKTTELIEKVLYDVESEWAVYFDDAFQTIFGSNTFPSKLFITAESDLVSIFESFLKLDKSDSTSAFRKKGNVLVIKEDSLSAFCSFVPQFKPDEFIILLSLFYAKFKSADPIHN